ncbi:MAG: aldo/keto reductase [Alphaproteobacteria bacterium]|nr:aldo/keto reductase [Alphaproteobacteria bacterium]
MIYIAAQGRQIPALGFGTYKLKGSAGRDAIANALETGYRHIDTAQFYDNEADVGAAVAASGVARADIFLTTKIWPDNAAEGKLQFSFDESLRKLKTDYADLLLIHWPSSPAPFREQMKALQSVKDAGKAKLIGVSNFTVAQTKEVLETIGAPVAANQVEYHPYLSQNPLLDYMRAHGLFLTAYCPVAQGKVTKDPVIGRIANAHGKTPSQVALRWLVQQDNVAAIPKAGSEAHIRENFDIFDFALSDQEMKQISALARPDGRIVNPQGIAPKWDKAA